MNDALRRELLAMIERDYRVHEEIGPPELASDPRLRTVHRQNAARLAEIVEVEGWPTETFVGADGAFAAWRMVHHMVDQPQFERAMLVRLQRAAAEGRVEAWKAATLEDRIRASEGRPQRYGTQFGWDENGEYVPVPPIEDPVHVDELRTAAGFPPIAEFTELQRELSRRRPVPNRDEILRLRALFDEQCRLAGWR